MAGRALPPKDEAELLARARALAGRPLSWVAAQRNEPVPSSLRRNRGWVGELLERVLGSHAKSRAEPDFPRLGVEMKSIPVDARGSPLEETFVCAARLDGTLAADWSESWVRKKLAAVLWVPILVGPDTAPGDRIVGASFLWRPDPSEEAAIRADWEQVAEVLRTGALDRLDRAGGPVLHLRPRVGARGGTTQALDQQGDWVPTAPRAFYLRASFTGALLRRHLRLG